MDDIINPKLNLHDNSNFQHKNFVLNLFNNYQNLY